tara:strand:+ start:36938 stop:37588 length:651 start_codon:yes stop_codon:yes gene_type:complete
MYKKKCKGTHKYTYGLGCGEMVNSNTRKFGIGKECGCFKEFLKSDKSNDYIKKQVIPKAKRNIQEVAKEKKREFKQRKRDLNKSSVMSLADTYFSRFIRLKHSKNGFCTCYTCGTLKEIKNVDNGHFEKRGNQATRYHENNCRPQCKTCNGNTSGNGRQKEFRKQLVNEIGEIEVLEIERLAKTTFKTNSLHFKDVADKYRNLVNYIQNKLGVKYW